MKLPQFPNKLKWSPLSLAFCLPAGMMLVLLFVTSASPFGDYSMLYSDMYHQYFPFFKAFRAALRSGESLLWSWSAGLGMDYLGLISYYLASPLNLLSVLVPDGWELAYFSLLMPIKLGLASLSFAYMLKKLFGRSDWSVTLFGCMYGLCSWALGYQWNIMWLDTFALVPLVSLGTVLLLRDKKFILYTWSLFLAIFANYYIGFFVCIFVFLLFFCYEICRFKSVGRFMADFCRIGLFTVIAIGMTAVLELPALASLQNTYSSVNNFPEGFQINMVAGEAVNAAKEAWAALDTAREAGEAELWPLLWQALKASIGPVWEGMRKVAGQMGGGMNLTYMDGLPNIYCGVGALALGFLFLQARAVKLRDKLCAVFLLLFFMMSFIIRQLDYIWHGFHFTNQIPYRFSFLFSFVLLYMAYRAWLLREQFAIWQIVLSGILSVAMFLMNRDNWTNLAYIAFNGAFLGLYLTAMLYGHRDLVPQREPEKPAEEPEPEMPAIFEEEAEPKTELLPEEEEAELARTSWLDRFPTPEGRARQAGTAMAFILVAELVLNVVSFAAGYGIYNYDYPKNDEATSSMLQVMRDQENGESLFYRVEMTHAQTLNDGPLNGYNGISTFTSSANVRVTEFMKAIGFGAWDTYNRYCYEEASPVANLFLNLKYMVERENEPGPNGYFDILHSYKGVTLMENNAYLPLGFLARPALEEAEFNATNHFQSQNKLFSKATGLEAKVWHTVPSKTATVVTENVTVKLENQSGYTSYTSGPNGGRLMYEYILEQEGFMALDINLYANKDFSVWYNGRQLYRDTYSLPQLIAVCNVKEGDKVQVVVECNASEESAVSIKAATLDDELFRQGYQLLKESTLELTNFSTTYIAGTIDCKRDGLLYTSIPQDGNWKVIVDGEEVETTLVGEAMLALHLTKGAHTVEFRYENRAFRLGLGISLGCGGLFGLCILGQYLVNRRKKREAA